MSFHPHNQRAFFEEYTFTQKMDQDLARVKNATGLTLLCVDLPKKINHAIEFGINLFAYRVCDGGRWKGAKNAPEEAVTFSRSSGRRKEEEELVRELGSFYTRKRKVRWKFGRGTRGTSGFILLHLSGEMVTNIFNCKGGGGKGKGKGTKREIDFRSETR